MLGESEDHRTTFKPPPLHHLSTTKLPPLINQAITASIFGEREWFLICVVGQRVFCLCEIHGLLHLFFLTSGLLYFGPIFHLITRRSKLGTVKFNIPVYRPNSTYQRTGHNFTASPVPPGMSAKMKLVC